MKKIIITGSSGFIGTNLVKDLLEKKLTVYAILRKSKKNIHLSKNLKKNYKNYNPILFKNFNELQKKFVKIKANYTINLATTYMNQHETKDIEKILDSNVFFCSLILDLSCKIKIKKFINLCSVMQHYKGRPLNPQNFYAASKEMFNIAIRYYKNNNRKIKFYNLYISDTYGKGDNRRKILPTIIKNFKKNKITVVRKVKLELNILNVKDILNAIFILMNKKITDGEYIIRAKKNIELKNLIKVINNKLKKKIKIKWLNDKHEKENKFKIKKLPFWRQKHNIYKDLISDLNENY